jgi:hypothetical protein
MAAAKNVPVPPKGPMAEAMRGKQIASRGGQLPKILQDFIRRVSNTKKLPITYEEARDFYVNSRLAMSEYLQTKPNMWRQVALFKTALDEAINEAAEVAGKGAEYRGAMDDYRRAMKLKNLAKTAAAIGIPALLGYKLNKMLSMFSKAQP